MIREFDGLGFLGWFNPWGALKKADKDAPAFSSEYIREVYLEKIAPFVLKEIAILPESSEVGLDEDVVKQCLTKGKYSTIEDKRNRCIDQIMKACITTNITELKEGILKSIQDPEVRALVKKYIDYNNPSTFIEVWGYPTCEYEIERLLKYIYPTLESDIERALDKVTIKRPCK